MNEIATDAVLLRRYADERSEAAFAELVRRYLDLVYSAALRRLNGDAHRAQDVAQHVFTALARESCRLSRHRVLSAWLYTATRNAAIDLIRAEQRRHAREQEATAMQTLFTSTPDADWEKLRPVLDEVMDELSEVDRTAVLLRFFEKRPFAEIGVALQLSEDAARMRVDRALEKLHLLLRHRGVSSTAGALTAVLANQAVATAPVGLAAAITGTALSGAAVAGAGTLATVLYFMSTTKISLTVAGATALTLGVAVYESSQAHETARELARARGEQRMEAARFGELEANATAAEAELAARRVALERQRAERLAAGTKSQAPAPDAEAEQARQAKALQQFIDRDPEFQRLRVESARASFMAVTGWKPLPSNVTRSRQESAEEFVQKQQAILQQRAAGVEPTPSLPSDNNIGESVVRELAKFNYYADDPFTADQVSRLRGILAASITSRDSPNGGWNYAWFDWDRVLRDSQPVLSPKQLEGLRASAAWGRVQGILAAARKESEAGSK